MAKWVKGQSGNPRGSPPKPRRLTNVLKTALAKQVTLSDGTKMQGNKYIADLFVQMLTKGQVVLASGDIMVIGPSDFFEVIKWVFAQIDGPPKAELDVTSGGSQIKVIVQYEDDNPETPALPPGPTDDSLRSDPL